MHVYSWANHFLSINRRVSSWLKMPALLAAYIFIYSWWGLRFNCRSRQCMRCLQICEARTPDVRHNRWIGLHNIKHLYKQPTYVSIHINISMIFHVSLKQCPAVLHQIHSIGMSVSKPAMQSLFCIRSILSECPFQGLPSSDLFYQNVRFKAYIIKSILLECLFQGLPRSHWSCLCFSQFNHVKLFLRQFKFLEWIFIDWWSLLSDASMVWQQHNFQMNLTSASRCDWHRQLGCACID